MLVTEKKVKVKFNFNPQTEQSLFFELFLKVTFKF